MINMYLKVDDKKQPYGYETSDLKNLYLSRHELESKLKGMQLLHKKNY